MNNKIGCKHCIKSIPRGHYNFDSGEPDIETTLTDSTLKITHNNEVLKIPVDYCPFCGAPLNKLSKERDDYYSTHIQFGYTN